MASSGMEFLLEIEAKLDDALRTVKVLNQITQAADKTDDALKKTEKQTGLLGRAFGGTGKAVKSFGSGVGQHLTALALWDGLKAGSRILVDLGKDLFTAAAEAQRTEDAFKGMLGVEAGTDILDWIDKVASKTEFTDGSLKDFAQNLANAGFAGEGLKDQLAAVLDVAANSTDKMDGASRAVAVFSKVMKRGGLSDKDIEALGLKSGAVYAQMSKDLGMGQKTLEKQLLAGKIRTVDIIASLNKAIAAKTGKDLGGVGLDRGQLIGAKLEHVKDIVPNLMEELSKSGGLDGVSKFMGRLVEAFSPDSPVGKKVIGALDLMATRLGAFLETVDFNKLADQVVYAMDVVATAFQIGAAVAGFVVKAFVTVGEVLGQSAAGYFLAYEKLVAFGGDVITFVTGLPALLMEKTIAIGTAIWEGIVNGITGGIGFVTDAVGGLADAAVGKLKGVLGIHSPSAVFAAFGEMTAEGFSIGLQMPDIEGAVREAFDPMRIAPPSLAIGAELGSTAAGGGGIGSVSISAPVSISVGGTNATPQEIAEAVTYQLPGALAAALEQLALEGGF